MQGGTAAKLALTVYAFYYSLSVCLQPDAARTPTLRNLRVGYETSIVFLMKFPKQTQYFFS